MNDEGINEVHDWEARVRPVAGIVQSLWDGVDNGVDAETTKIGFRLPHQSD